MTNKTNLKKLLRAANKVSGFKSIPLKSRLRDWELSLGGKNGSEISQMVVEQEIDQALVSSLFIIKDLAGEINVMIHAVGILMCMPYILKDGEVVEKVSLGAGNTGRNFDLETSMQVAEFKFIRWRGGADTIRQNSIFKDFYGLAETKTSKTKCLYLMGLDIPMKFFRGSRSIESVTSRNRRLWTDFTANYGERFITVNEYYEFSKDRVKIVDILEFLPDISSLLDELI